MIQGKWFAPGENLAELLPVRRAVFGRGEDPLDAESWNVLVYEDEIPTAAGRIWWRDGAYRLSDLCVLQDRRGRKLGDLVLRLLLFKAQSHAAREVRLSCSGDLCGFFARLGFHPESTEEDQTEMLLEGDRIELDSCKNCRRENCPSRKD